MLKITITSTAVHTKSGVGKNGRPYEIREQAAWIHLVAQDGKPDPYPTSMMIMLEKQAAPYATGDYQLHPSSIESGRFGSLQIKPLLVPMNQAVRAAA